jgi:hypothetical protein
MMRFSPRFGDWFDYTSWEASTSVLVCSPGRGRAVTPNLWLSVRPAEIVSDMPAVPPELGWNVAADIRAPVRVSNHTE